MTLQKIYLTIDDSPSIHMDKKVSFLKKHNIPAIFYARGEHIAAHTDQIINAIQHGFLIGNHSYSHPHFSQISFNQCTSEILKTEKLIQECYKLANKVRPCKIIRLPYGDRGVGENAKTAQSQEEQSKVKAIQDFLKENDFVALNFQSDHFIDAHWDWDTQDYKRKHISDEKLYLDKIKTFFGQHQKETAILLLHDFDNNNHLFKPSMQFLLDQKIEFLNYQVQQ